MWTNWKWSDYYHSGEAWSNSWTFLTHFHTNLGKSCLNRQSVDLFLHIFIYTWKINWLNHYLLQICETFLLSCSSIKWHQLTVTGLIHEWLWPSSSRSLSFMFSCSLLLPELYWKIFIADIKRVQIVSLWFKENAKMIPASPLRNSVRPKWNISDDLTWQLVRDCLDGIKVQE